MKRLLIIYSAVLLTVSLCGCAVHKDAAAPAFHSIAAESPTDPTRESGGAAAYDHILDNPDTRYYAINDYYNMESSGTLHILSRFETCQQTTEYTCGCASARMVLHYFGSDGYSERELAERMDVSEETGTSVESLAGFFTELGWQVEVHADTSPLFEDEDAFEAFVVDRIDAGIPIMIDWTDWAGHWQVIIGIDTCGADSADDDVLILADPYDVTDHYQDGYYTYPLSRLYYLWREGPCGNKDVPYEQPFVAAKPD